MDAPEEITGESDALSAWRIYNAYWNPAALHADAINAQMNEATQELYETISKSSDAYKCISASRDY